MSKHGLGYLPDTFDRRDYRFSSALPPQAIPAASSLPRGAQPVLDQGQLGSCVWNAMAGAVLFHQPDFMLSRLYGYYRTRVIEHSTKEDAGCQIRDAVKVLVKDGAPPESDWPYDISKFARRPPAKAYRDAKKEVVLKYERIATPHDARACIASGNPYLVGFLLYESFESEEVARTGHVPLPSPGERIIGGHCVLGWGYDPQNDTFLNSWAEDWGDKGFFHMPRGYLDDPKLASDMWAIQICQQAA
jgi:C1A family cysteine protease